MLGKVVVNRLLIASDCQASLSRLLGVFLIDGLSNVAIAARFVNRSVFEPGVVLDDAIDINFLVRRDHIVHDVVDQISQSHFLCIIDLRAIGFLDLVVDLLGASNVSVRCDLDVEEGLEHHSRVSVEIKKRHLIEVEALAVFLQFGENGAWRFARRVTMEDLLDSLGLTHQSMLEADDVRDEAVREADGTGLNARVGDACLVKTRDAHEHELELTLHDHVRQTAVLLLDDIRPGVGEVSEDIAFYVLLCEWNIKRHAHIAIARLSEIPIGLTQQSSDLALSLHVSAHLSVSFSNVDLDARCNGWLLLLAVIKVHRVNP